MEEEEVEIAPCAPEGRARIDPCAETSNNVVVRAPRVSCWRQCAMRCNASALTLLFSFALFIAALIVREAPLPSSTPIPAAPLVPTTTTRAANVTSPKTSEPTFAPLVLRPTLQQEEVPDDEALPLSVTLSCAGPFATRAPAENDCLQHSRLETKTDRCQVHHLDRTVLTDNEMKRLSALPEVETQETVQFLSLPVSPSIASLAEVASFATVGWVSCRLRTS